MMTGSGTRNNYSVRDHCQPEFPFCLSDANQYTPICHRSRSLLHPFPSRNPRRVPGRAASRTQKTTFAPFRSDFTDPSPSTSSVVQIGFASLARLPGWQRQSLQAPQYAPEQAPRQVALRQQQPIVAGMLDQPPAGFHQPLLQTG